MDSSMLVDQEDKLKYINYKLNYINKVIQPFFSQSTINNDWQQVSQNKLINLWISKRKKAIKVVEKNGW